MSWLSRLTDKFKKPEPMAKVEVITPTVEPVVTPITTLEHKPAQTQRMEIHNELSEDEKFVLIDLIAQGFTPSMISKKMLEDHNVKVQAGNIYKYQTADKWKPIIKNLKIKYRDSVHEIGISHKSTRLKIMEYVADRAVEKNDLRMILKSTEEARKEFEKNGDGDVNNIFINNPTYNELNVLSTDELLRRKAESTKRLTQKETS